MGTELHLEITQCELALRHLNGGRFLQSSKSEALEGGLVVDRSDDDD